MATRRTSKKKVPATAPVLPSEPEAPVVKQVVEEISSDTPKDVIEGIKEEAQKIEEDAEKLEEALPQEETVVASVTEAPETGEQGDEPTLPPQEETKEREVVSELYKPKRAEIAPEIIVETGSSIKPLLIWSLVVIGIALLTGGTLLVAVRGLQGVSVAKPTPTPSVGLTPTPTPPAAKRQDVKIQVLNGGGVAGSGAKMKTFLEEKGYTVTDVKNADEFTYESTEITVKPGKTSHLNLLKKDVEESYTVASATATLSADSPYDAQVIVGKK